MLANMTYSFLSQIQLPNAAGPEYVQVRENLYERAQWITRENITRRLNTSLVTDYVRDDGTISQTGLSTRVLSLKLPLVPLVDAQARFKCLVDRTKILDSLGDQFVKSNQKS